MEVRRVLVILCFCVVLASAAKKAGKSKPENLEDTYGALADDEVQNDDFDEATDYGDDVESPPNQNEDNDPAEKEPVVFNTKPGVFVANIGETLRLPCEVSNPDIVLIWQRDETYLFQGGVAINNFPNIEEFENSTLEIKIQGETDFGNYACILMTTNDIKSRPKIVHSVVKPTPPTIQGIYTNKNNETVYKPGETMVLTCAATGYPNPIISWHKGNERLAFTGATLTIPNIKPEDDGLYRCLADSPPSNQVPGSIHLKPSHHHILINVEHVPKIRVKEYLVTSKKEEDAELTCSVDAYPQAKIIWKKGEDNILNEGKNQIKVNRKQNEVESILLISDLTDDDFTTYTCFARNSLGKTEQKVDLVKVPVVREFVKPEKSNKDVVLTWKVESTSPISAHEIQYRKKGEAEWKSAKPVVTRGESNIYTVKYTLKDLDAGGYETRVRSRSEHGWSEYSDIMPFEGVLAKQGSSTHKNHHKKHHKDQKEKESKELHTSSVQEATSVPQQQEIIQKEAPVGASTPGSSSSVKSSAAILSIALFLLFSVRQ